MALSRGPVTAHQWLESGDQPTNFIPFLCSLTPLLPPIDFNLDDWHCPFCPTTHYLCQVAVLTVQNTVLLWYHQTLYKLVTEHWMKAHYTVQSSSKLLQFIPSSNSLAVEPSAKSANLLCGSSRQFVLPFFLLQLLLISTGDTHWYSSAQTTYSLSTLLTGFEAINSRGPTRCVRYIALPQHWKKFFI